MKKMKVALFASGTGSNAVKLIEYFKGHDHIEVALVLSNNLNAKVLTSSDVLGVRNMYRDNSFVADGNALTSLMEENEIDWIVLAGYLRLIPETLIEAYPGRIINLHPALLPKYGGKGMYGHHVHEAVIANKEKESGITIHMVNARFDEGMILAQFHCPVEAGDTPESLYSEKIQYLEHNFFPVVVEKTILNPLYA